MTQREDRMQLLVLVVRTVPEGWAIRRVRRAAEGTQAARDGVEGFRYSTPDEQGIQLLNGDLYPTYTPRRNWADSAAAKSSPA
jgi:hypothetical protein